MPKTPDEIKKGMECCAASYADCHKECPYKPDCDGSQILKDALALIRWHEEKNEAMHAEIVRLQAERDATVEEVHGNCHSCKYYIKDPKEEPCASCLSGFGNKDNWQWRGVQKEDGNETA
jgi:hypothetical protein